MKYEYDSNVNYKDLCADWVIPKVHEKVSLELENEYTTENELLLSNTQISNNKEPRRKHLFDLSGSKIGRK
jgi:hypothetical protein